MSTRSARSVVLSPRPRVPRPHRAGPPLTRGPPCTHALCAPHGSPPSTHLAGSASTCSAAPRPPGPPAESVTGPRPSLHSRRPARPPTPCRPVSLCVPCSARCPLVPPCPLGLPPRVPPRVPAPLPPRIPSPLSRVLPRPPGRSPPCVPSAGPMSPPRVSPPPRAPAELWDRRAQEVAGRRGRGRRAAGRAGRDGGRGRRAPHSLRPDAGPGAPRAGAQRPSGPERRRRRGHAREEQVAAAAGERRVPEVCPLPAARDRPPLPPQIAPTRAPRRSRPAALRRARGLREDWRTGTGDGGPWVPSQPPGPRPARPKPGPVLAGRPGALQPGARLGPGRPRRGGLPGWARERHPCPSPRGLPWAPLLRVDATRPRRVSGSWQRGPRARPRPCALRPRVSFTFCSAGRGGLQVGPQAVVGLSVPI